MKTREKNIYVFDIDGTIADETERHMFLNPETSPTGKKDWGKYFDGMLDDIPFTGMVTLMKELSASNGSTIILQTGRPERYRVETSRWLKKHGLSNSFDILLMRLDGDYSPAIDLKQKFYEWIYEHYMQEPAVWFEDNEEVLMSVYRMSQGRTSILSARML